MLKIKDNKKNSDWRKEQKKEGEKLHPDVVKTKEKIRRESRM